MPREGVQRRAAAAKRKSYNEIEFWNEHVEELGEEEGLQERFGASPTPDRDDEDERMDDSDEVPQKRKRKPTRKKRNPDDEYTEDDEQAAEDDEEEDFEEEVEDEGEDDQGRSDSEYGSDVIGPVRKVSAPVAAKTPPTAARQKIVRPVKQKATRKVTAPKAVQKVHARGVEAFRGLDDLGRAGGQLSRLIHLFGPSEGNLLPVLQTRDHWTRQETLPTRRNQGLRHSFFTSEGTLEKETTITRKWYDEFGKANFAEDQSIREFSKEDGIAYLANGAPDEINFLMGAYANPLLYHLKQRGHISTALPFINKDDRRGWVIYLGNRIQDAQWAPVENSSTQYLAVAVEQKNMDRHNKHMENPQAPAFTATDRFPASIQIWSFEADEQDRLDPTKEPRLELVICADWGAPKALRWCPIPPTETVIESAEGTTVHLGLLAGIWSDGKLRVLDVSFEKTAATAKETRYVHYSKAAFEAGFHNTIPSSLSWLSGTSIIVGTAIGAIAFYTLSRPDAFPPPNHAPDQQYNPTPRLYKRLSDTFILSISTGFPSRPNYVCATAADGLGWLFDLRSPFIDIVNNARGRMYSITSAWSEHAQAFLTPDDSFLLRCSSVRRFHMNIYAMRMDSQVTCIATSPVHPGALVGTADGTVESGNPLMRVLNHKEVSCQQTWFRHDWRRPVSELLVPLWDPSKPPPEPPKDDSEDAEEDLADGTPAQFSHAPPAEPPPLPPYTGIVPESVLAKPLTRITEGFKARPVTLHYTKPVGKKKKVADPGVRFLTVFEEKSAITCVAWNPNLRWGTWACAGMGDGLLRVEDIGV